MGETIRKYGTSPYKVVLIHGGPGAAGELTLLANELGKHTGILEPLQTKLSIEELITELDDQVSMFAKTPVTLVGHSWGAWLGMLYASRFNKKVRRLVLVSSGPFEPVYAANIINVRVGRMTDNNRKRLFRWIEQLNEPEEKNKNDIFRRVGDLIYEADSFDPIPGEKPEIRYDYDAYSKIWNEAQDLRNSGYLNLAASLVECPVIALHGDYDPHPSEGVNDPLKDRMCDFKFHMLRNCGHHPWEEKKARNEFLKILTEQIIIE